MRVNGINYEFDNVLQVSRPTLYPGASTDNWSIPEEISADFSRLNNVIEMKYSVEYLKICAFYNKKFQSLRHSTWSYSTYNAQAFTQLDQERSDTGSGIAMNYLKQIVDQVTSRLGTIKFTPFLISEEQTFEYIVYHDDVERIIRMLIEQNNVNRLCTEVFHDASILGYSYIFVDPFTGKLIKASDYEVGLFESQMTSHSITQMLYRNYSFPTAEAIKYLETCTEEQREEIKKNLTDTVSVDFCMYFNCLTQTCHVTINGKVLPAKIYPFPKVLVSIMQWDVGFSAVTTTSLFDLLYPVQREVNKINAKIQQLIRMYKGATPIFNSDVEIAMRSITNGSGECLYVDSTRPLDTLCTVINPTPIDSELTALVTEYKSIMYELAGLQSSTFDMNNMRSAAAVVALDQTRDSIFQAQLAGLSDFITDVLCNIVAYFAGYKTDEENNYSIDWPSVYKLVTTAHVSLKPVHVNDPLSDEMASRNEPIDYVKLSTARVLLRVIKGEYNYATLPYYIDKNQVTLLLAASLVKFEALNINVPDSVHEFLIAAFVDAIKYGEVIL